MPPKRPPAPIDRPLSKAYLREFRGWQTAYSPGLSEPNSLRLMQNAMITREGAVRVRPGLRSYMQTKMSLPIVGSHELFYTATGDRAYLVAVRDKANNRVVFRVLARPPQGGDVQELTLEEAGFEVNATRPVQFSLDTTYVRYLQIDNKIFALSNSPEPMNMFWVGSEKKALQLQEIARPRWSKLDKLTVVQPDENWITDNDPIHTRHNRVPNPEFVDLSKWDPGSKFGHEGAGRDRLWIAPSETFNNGVYPPGKTGAIESVEGRTNHVPNPIMDTATYGTQGWYGGDYTRLVEVVNGNMRWYGTPSNTGSAIKVYTDLIDVVPGTTMEFRWNHVAHGGTADGWGASIKWYKSNGEQIGNTVHLLHRVLFSPGVFGRAKSGTFTVPDQAAKVQLGLKFYVSSVSAEGWFETNNVWFGEVGEATSAFSGDDGPDYFWVGEPGKSKSVYHPPQDVSYDQHSSPITPNKNYFGSAEVRADPSTVTVDRTAEVHLRIFDSSFNTVVLQKGSATVPADGTPVRIEAPIAAAPSSGVRAELCLMVLGAARGEHFHWNAAHLEQASSPQTYFYGNQHDTTTLKYSWEGTPHASTSIEEQYGSGLVVPPAETATSKTLISSTAADNDYTIGFYYTISNELGESAESQVTVVKVQRPWTSWKWETPNAAGEPSGTETYDPKLAADQLVLTMPSDVFDAAIAAGATKWSGYVYMHGPNEAPPVTAIRFAEKELKSSSTHGSDGWLRLTPEITSIGVGSPVVPTESSRLNSTDPSRGSQGLVASDRLVLVGDPDDPARISWSAGVAGNYYNFSSTLGGGAKQLTSGNLYLTAAVKLWQNPQSVDTLTILTMGDNGMSNAYYMQPAQITSLSESIQVMGFEEVSGMEGTVSAYGCEIVNNAMYHPLEFAVVKSTANNYNVNHRTVSDEIQNVWRGLQEKNHIVTSTLDNRIYYLVHNVQGPPLEAGCWGNEVWVLDTQTKTPSWSRWVMQGISLRPIEIDNKPLMSLVHPDGIFALDPERATDEYFNPLNTISKRNIGWYIETNTQGANRAHDAWATLQQANVMFSSFMGQMHYGIRGQDANGVPIVVNKEVIAENPPATDVSGGEDDSPGATLLPWDREDYMLIRRTMKEWSFFAGSINDDIDVGNNETPADILTDTSQWVSVGFGYAYPHPAPEAVADGMELSWSAIPTQNPQAYGLQGVSLPQVENEQYTVTVTVVAPPTSARWRLTMAFASSSDWVVPDGTPQTMTLTATATRTFDEVWGIEVDGSADWSAAGTHRVTGFTFYAPGNVVPVPRFSTGQINMVQYRYLPATVNVGYEYGSVETFEYGAMRELDSTTDSGVPKPYIDMSR